jgi:hypothetical protein
MLSSSINEVASESGYYSGCASQVQTPRIEPTAHPNNRANPTTSGLME